MAPAGGVPVVPAGERVVTGGAGVVVASTVVVPVTAGRCGVVPEAGAEGAFEVEGDFEVEAPVEVDGVGCGGAEALSEGAVPDLTTGTLPCEVAPAGPELTLGPEPELIGTALCEPLGPAAPVEPDRDVVVAGEPAVDGVVDVCLAILLGAVAVVAVADADGAGGAPDPPPQPASPPASTTQPATSASRPLAGVRRA